MPSFCSDQNDQWTVELVANGADSLTVQVMFDGVFNRSLAPVSIKGGGAVDVFGNHGLYGLLKEDDHGKSPKYLGKKFRGLGECWKVSGRLKTFQTAFATKPYLLNSFSVAIRAFSRISSVK